MTAVPVTAQVSIYSDTVIGWQGTPTGNEVHPQFQPIFSLHTLSDYLPYELLSLGMCGSLNENGPHCLTFLNA